MSTPYDKMRVWLDELNEGVPRGERRTVEGKRGVLAMARSNDPFYAGQNSQREDARWFADLFRRLGFEGRRTHLRFVHYAAAGIEPNPETGGADQQHLPDSSPYENTKENWVFLQEAAKHARNMDLVDPRNIVDKRVKGVRLNAPAEPAPEPAVEVREPFVSLPSIAVHNLEPYVSPATARPTGYEYDRAHEPSLVEMWTEKDLDEADNPLFEDICDELGVNLIPGIGFMTISSFYALLQRRARLEKPLRILYVSDFDPAGEHMPVSPARHIEFAIRNMEEKPDIRLHHLALTAEQVRELELPRMPIRESDLRKGKFEERHGEGAVELNALMHPTRVSRTEEMLRNAIESLRDESLPRKLAVASMRARRVLDEEVERRLRWPHRALSLIEEKAREIAARYEEELRDIAEKLEEDMAPFEECAERVLHVARRRLEGLENVDLPGVSDLGVESEGAASGWLYDSSRDYLEQLAAYKRHKTGGEE